MSTLAERQAEIMASLLDEDRPLPANLGRRHEAGLQIYRNNYRTALVEALRSTFERTERLVGEASFARAAAHHLITTPPSSWTLDLAGCGFADTCADLFPHDREVAELAWLEWAMHLSFVARDSSPTNLAGFAQATAEFGPADWEGLVLRFAPGIDLRTVHHDLKALWSSLNEGEGEADIVPLDTPATVIVWREAERPVFLAVTQAEGDALASMIAGASYGQACAAMAEALGQEQAVETAGAMLGRWLGEGLVEGLA
ncbi:hypothetical protein GRI34_12405 [Erythrobacter aquimaris]|uniref:Putative DNA-binding domain-containing protein n=1 Tax=Qipengyuania aquimaris TaxID=255984 RepID=A0A6I4TPX2_9SPHN|nr:DNA-binding domain-containing protein [Qipengyuania aquimaris]MXO97220.1 hypothetical protein [Qipengyuania aquimaris]